MMLQEPVGPGLTTPCSLSQLYGTVFVSVLFRSLGLRILGKMCEQMRQLMALKMIESSISRFSLPGVSLL